MSSHHIVRENQEPALLVGHFHALSPDYLGQILEWSPTIVTDEYNLDFFLADEIKVDVLFSNGDIKIAQDQINQQQINTKFLEDALSFLLDKKYKAVNILTNSLDLDVLKKFANAINIVVFNESKRFVLVKNTYEKWKPKGDKVFVGEQYIKSFQGLNFVEPGVFEVDQDGFITLEFNSNDFVAVGEDI